MALCERRNILSSRNECNKWHWVSVPPVSTLITPHITLCITRINNAWAVANRNILYPKMMIAAVINSSWIILLGQTFPHVLWPHHYLLLPQSCSGISFVIALWAGSGIMPLNIHFDSDPGSGSDGTGVITGCCRIGISLSPLSLGAYSRPDCRERTTPQGRHRQDCICITAL